MRTLNDGTPIPFLRGIVWYTDGSKQTFSNVGEFEHLPERNVVLLQLLYNKPHKGKWMQEVLRGYDYYFEYRGDYHNRNARDIPKEVPETRIKYGATVDDPVFQSMYNQACDGVSIAG